MNQSNQSNQLNQLNQLKQSKTNSDYRHFLMQNTNSIMKENFINLHPLYISYEKTNTYPYLFNGINDKNKPRGYEESLPKQNYITQQLIESKKVSLLRNNY